MFCLTGLGNFDAGDLGIRDGHNVCTERPHMKIDRHGVNNDEYDSSATLFAGVEMAVEDGSSEALSGGTFGLNEPVTPALSAEKWSERMRVVPQGETVRDVDSLFQFTTTQEQHRIAAIALYEQHFGFTREQLGVLRLLAEDKELRGEWRQALRAVADRIAALLPPQGT